MIFHHHRLPNRSIDEDEEQANEHFLRSRSYLLMRLRLLKDSQLSMKISNEIKMETIEKGFLATIQRRKELLERIQQLNQQCRMLREKNHRLVQIIRQRHEENLRLEKIFRIEQK